MDDDRTAWQEISRKITGLDSVASWKLRVFEIAGLKRTGFRQVFQKYTGVNSHTTGVSPVFKVAGCESAVVEAEECRCVDVCAGILLQGARSQMQGGNR
jgi:hypothetical protein